MTITVLTVDDKKIVFTFKAHSAIDKMVEALKENIDDWVKITIEITK